MGKRNLRERVFPAVGQTQNHLAAVGEAANAFDQSVCFQSIHKFHSTVVLDLQALGEYSHRGATYVRQAFDRQQCLVLLWLDACGSGGLLAQNLKAPDFVAELGERLVIDSLVSS